MDADSLSFSEILDDVRAKTGFWGETGQADKGTLAIKDRYPPRFM
jgi:hypothetical protein